jgi:hypothetical protein
MFDNTVFALRNEHLLGIKNCVGTGSVEEALRMVKIAARPQSILLFTASGDGAEAAKTEFENTLNVLQGK